jgi:hypothetical protein
MASRFRMRPKAAGPVLCTYLSAVLLLASLPTPPSAGGGPAPLRPSSSPRP